MLKATKRNVEKAMIIHILKGHGTELLYRISYKYTPTIFF